MNNIQTKICKGCLLSLPSSSFNKHSETKDGLRAKCIECRRIENIQYRKSDPEKTKARQKVLDNRKRLNPSWKSRSRDKRNANDAWRRSMKLNATPKWTTQEDRKLISEFYTVCQMFKIYTGMEYHVDHIVPLTSDIVCGLHTSMNLQVISAFENLSKNNKFDESLAIDHSAEAYVKSTLPVGPLTLG